MKLTSFLPKDAIRTYYSRISRGGSKHVSKKIATQNLSHFGLMSINGLMVAFQLLPVWELPNDFVAIKLATTSLLWLHLTNTQREACIETALICLLPKSKAALTKQSNEICKTDFTLGSRVLVNKTPFLCASEYTMCHSVHI